MHFQRLVSSPSVVELISGLGEVEAALQISAMGAQWLTREDVPADVVETTLIRWGMDCLAIIEPSLIGLMVCIVDIRN